MTAFSSRIYAGLKDCYTPALTAEGGCATRPSQLLDRDFAQEFEVAEHFAGAEHNAGQGIIGDGDRQAGFFADALIQILEQGAAAGEHDAAVADVGGKFGRSALQGDANGVHDGAHAFAQGLANLAIVHGNGFGHALDEVAAFDLHGQRLIERIAGADLDLDLLGGALANEQVVLALEVIHDGLIHLVAGHAHGTRVNYAAERDDSDIGC